jgi:hypothetical protein
LALPAWQARYPEDGWPEAAILAAEAWALDPTEAANRAACAASDAACAVWDAASDAACAVWDAARAASDAARDVTRRQCAYIVRSIIDCPSLEGV